jgi:hypothetical protein
MIASLTEQTRQTPSPTELEEGEMFSSVNFPQATPRRLADVARGRDVSAAEA